MHTLTDFIPILNLIIWQYYPHQMLDDWMFKTWRHNRTQSKLVPLVRLKQKPYWIYLILSVLAMGAAAYSLHGFVQDIFPNLSFIK